MARRIGSQPSVTQVVTALRKRLHRIPHTACAFSRLGLEGRVMRGRAILALLGITALGAYSVGRQSAPVSNPPATAASAPSPSA
jgi:hypothetical protein